MKTAIIIPSRTKDLLEGCLGALKLTTPGLATGEVGVVVVANGTEKERSDVDVVVRTFRGSLPPEAVVDSISALTTPLFYGNLCDKGVEQSRNRDAVELVFLNDDTHPGTGWLQSFRADHLNAVRQNFRPGLWGARGTNVSGPQNVFDPTEIAARQRIYRHDAMKMLEPNPVAFLYPRIVTFAAFCTAEAYEKAGGFDVALPAHNWSDDILSVRMLKAGYLNFISGAFVHHLGSATLARQEEGDDAEAIQKRYQADMDAGRAYFDTAYPDGMDVLEKAFLDAGIR